MRWLTSCLFTFLPGHLPHPVIVELGPPALLGSGLEAGPFVATRPYFGRGLDYNCPMLGRYPCGFG